MRILAVFLSFYILALNFTTCSDTLVTNNDIPIEIVQKSDTNHNHADCDLCSPFCQCHCCHIHVIHFSSTEAPSRLNDISTKIFVHFDSMGSDYTEILLHPPRV